MIKFFRKIRKRLLTENKFSKYLIYAIGEIVLVMIGILLALQVNNWNSNRQDLKRSKTVLKSIKEDIIADTLEIENFYDLATEELFHVNAITKRIKSNPMILDSLIKIAKFEFSYYWMGKPIYSNDSYESIKSSGFIEKLPQGLKKGLKDYYDQKEDSENIIDKMNDQYRTHFDEFSHSYSPIVAEFGEPRHYTYLEEVSWQNVNPKHFNPRFNALIGAKSVLSSVYLDELKIVKRKSKILLAKIDKYLNN